MMASDKLTSGIEAMWNVEDNFGDFGWKNWFPYFVAV
jgi:hypothetical protein